MSSGNFFGELKRRNVVRMAGLYLVGAWLLVQVAGTVLPMFGAPDWLPRSIVILLAIGFVPALIFSWVFELTPQGLKRDEDVAPEQSIAPQTARRMDRMIIAVLALALAYFAFDKWVLAPRREMTQARPAFVPNELANASAKSIAVLPFENLSDDKNAAYFADGVQDEILTKLAGIADLKVISRTSTAKYKSKPEDLKTVSQQLGVATVLEGTVQKAADKVRVNVQLIDARADSHLWARTYDRDIEDVFAVETEVAQEIADSLQAKLSPAEASTVASAPTQDTAAYDLFLKGEFEYRFASSSLRPERYDQAAAWYEQAIARDPNFAIAIAHLVICRLNRHWFVENLTGAQLAEIKKMAEHAVSLAPRAADAYVALGLYHYFGFRQYQQALAAFARALELQPNSASALEYSGYVHRRLGEWKMCVAELTKALELDPRNADTAGNLGQTYTLMRQWSEAERRSRNALAIDPHDVIGMRALLLTLTNSSGDLANALQLLKSFPPDEKIVTTSISGTIASVTGERAYTFVLARDFDAALKVWDSPPTSEIDLRAQLAARATIHVIAGDLAAAKIDNERAREVLEKRVRDRPTELISLRQLSWVYIAIGQKTDALRVAQQLSDLLPPEKDALLGVATLAGLAEIEARVGAPADAVSILRRLLSIPAGESVSIARLKIDPVWDPIRHDPAFQQLLTLKEHVGP